MKIEYRVILIFLAIISFGCKKNTDIQTKAIDKKKENNNIIAQKSKISFLDSILLIDSKKPFRIRDIGGKILKEEEFYKLNLNRIFDSFNKNHFYRLYYKINISDNFKVLAIGTSNKKYSSIYLATYNSKFCIVDFILAHEYNKKIFSKITHIYQDKLYIEKTTLPSSEDYSQIEYYLEEAEEYYIDHKGIFKKSNRPVTFRHYKFSDGFKGNLHNMPKLNVSAKNGLVIRDSLGKRIGKLDFGETVYIVCNTKDTITLKDEGKTITGSKIKIVINKDSVKTGKDFYIDKSNTGFVFSGFLYSHDSFHDEIHESHYSYDRITLGKGHNEADINLREMFDIRTVNLKDYKAKIIANPKYISPPIPKKKDKSIELNFDNGNRLILKDSTYQSEYKPTRSYYVSYHPDFKDAYLLSERMHFTDEIYSVISKKNGDTLNQFNGYPHISPNKSYSVSVFPDWTECNQQTSLVINRLQDNKYINYAYISVNSWSYPIKLNSDGIPIDDFSIHWLSDNEFIIKVKNPEECYLGEVIKPFYLKYKIK